MLAGLLLVPAVALADGLVEHRTRVRNDAVDPLARKLIDFFTSSPRGPADRLPGRILGRRTALPARRRLDPPWLLHFRRQLVRGLSRDAREGHWGHPLQGVRVTVMSIEGGPARAARWRALACGGHWRSKPTLEPLFTTPDGALLLALELHCPHREAKLILVTDEAGAPRAAYGIAGPSLRLRMATLVPGHKPLVQLPGNHFVAQVQWPVAAPAALSLPRVERFGAAPAPAPARGAWLFSPQGRPLYALYGPDLKVARRIGLGEVFSTGGGRVLWQLLADGGRRSWRVDHHGRVRLLPGPVIRR